MEKEIINPITGYFINVMNGGFGWIQLRNGNNDAGYIYFEDEPVMTKDRFGAATSAHPYVVTGMSKSMWEAILKILKEEVNLFIRGYDSGNGEVTAFIFSSEDGVFVEKSKKSV